MVQLHVDVNYARMSKMSTPRPTTEIFGGDNRKGILYINKEYVFFKINGLRICQGNPALTRFYKVFSPFLSRFLYLETTQKKWIRFF